VGTEAEDHPEGRAHAAVARHPEGRDLGRASREEGVDQGALADAAQAEDGDEAASDGVELEPGQRFGPSDQGRAEATVRRGRVGARSEDGGHGHDILASS